MHDHSGDGADGRSDFARLVRLLLVALPLPALALLMAGRRRAGLALLAVGSAVAVGTAVLLLRDGLAPSVARVGAHPDLLVAVAAGAVAGALAWSLAIVTTAVAAWPSGSSRVRTVLAVTLTASLCVGVSAPAALVARYALVTRTVTTQVFALPAPVPPQGVSRRSTPHVGRRDPWAGIPRVTVLLLGLDAGPGRVGARPDSILVASIDTATGDTTLFGLPRNLEDVPFPRSSPLHDLWPHGFDCGSDCLLNAVWTEAVDHAERFPGDPNPGLTATRSTVEEILGLRVDHTVMVTMKGFRDLVDAMGGVEVTVHQRLPIGGSVDGSGRVTEVPSGYLHPGRQHLDGYHAEWFARSRFSTNDFDRMRRQRCLVRALTAQADPWSLVAHFPALAAATGRNLRTDIPLSDLPAWAELAQRVGAGSMTTLPFTDDVIAPARPDFHRIRALVRQALAEGAAARRAGVPGGSATTGPASRATAAAAPRPAGPRARPSSPTAPSSDGC